MRLIGKPPKQDPVKAATYHPKEFRGRRLFITCGSTWYGAQLFGPGSVVDELNAPVVFTRNEAGGLRGMMIELTQRLGGTLQSRQSQ